MPERNFWISAEIDTPSGAKQILAGGPAARDGGFTLSIQMLDEGNSLTVVTIEGKAHMGMLFLDGSSEDRDTGEVERFAITTRRDKIRKARPKAERSA